MAASPYRSAPVPCQCSGDPVEMRCSISSPGVVSSAVPCSANKPCLERASDLFNGLHACSAGAREHFEPRAPTQPLPFTWLLPAPGPGRQNVVLSCGHPAARNSAGLRPHKPSCRDLCVYDKAGRKKGTLARASPSRQKPENRSLYK